MAVCLLPEAIAKFKQALKEKSIKIEDLLNMSTEQRTALLEKYAGANAKDVNLLFEQKLVLKNKLQGIKNWASKVGEIGKYDPAKKAQIDKALKDFQELQQERMFSPKETETFLNDLVDKKLGTHITQEQAKTVFDLTEKTKELKTKYDETKPSGQRWDSDLDRAQYGAQKVILEKYIESLKSGKSLKEIFGQRKQEFKTTWQDNKVKAVFDLAKDALNEISNNMISLVASLDNSFLGRQGLNTLNTHPTIWWNEMVKKSFRDMFKTLTTKENMTDVLMAEVYSSENYINGRYEKAGIIPKAEEQFPTSLPGQIPILGKAFSASEIAFKGSALRSRMKLFDLLLEKAEGNGVEITDAHIKDFGKLTNSLTARGAGKVTESGVVKLVLWAPRMLKANLDVLTGHGLGVGLETSFARKQAAINITKIVVETAVVMAISNIIKPGSAEVDPRSSDFGKIKVGNTRFDYFGGKGAIITLASRIAMALLGKPAFKSTSTGIFTKLNTGEYGERTIWDLVNDFLTNKTNPPARIIVDILKGQNFKGDKTTFKSEVKSLTPIALQNLFELKDDASVGAIIGVLADALGISSNTYKYETDWSQSTSKEMTEFKNEVGEEKFKQANDEFNRRVNNLLNSDKYKTMSNEEKQIYLDKQKTLIKKDILNKP